MSNEEKTTWLVQYRNERTLDVVANHLNIGKDNETYVFHNYHDGSGVVAVVPRELVTYVVKKAPLTCS